MGACEFVENGRCVSCAELRVEWEWASFNDGTLRGASGLWARDILKFRLFRRWRHLTEKIGVHSQFTGLTP